MARQRYPDCCTEATETCADYHYLFPGGRLSARGVGIGRGAGGGATLSLHPAVGWMYSCAAGAIDIPGVLFFFFFVFCAIREKYRLWNTGVGCWLLSARRYMQPSPPYKRHTI